MARRAPRPERRFNPALRRKIELARLALGVEGLWPLIAAPLAIAATYLALAMFGAFTGTALWLRIGLAAAFGGGFLWSLWRLLRWRAPEVEAGVARLDLNDPRLHRPLATLSDRPAGDDPVARRLWTLHRQRAEQAAARVRVAPPVSMLPGRDRYALRALALMLLVGGVFAAGDEKLGRLGDAFHFGAPRTPPVPPRLDAWVDPPTYTGRAPIFLSGPNAPSGEVHVPIGSTLVVRVSPGADIAIEAAESFREKKVETPAGVVAVPSPIPAAAPFEKRLVTEADGGATVRRGAAVLARYDLKVIPDRPPTVELLDVEPEAKGQSLRVRYRFNDDYGIARAEAIIARPAGGRTLIGPPEVVLSGRSGENESLITAPEHPWAGTRVTVRIRVEDDIGQQA